MDRSTILDAVSIGVGLLGLVAALVAHRRISSSRRSLALLQGTANGETLVDAVATYVNQVKKVRGDLDALGRRQNDLFNKLRQSARNVGLVRYDAFEEMGGRMSFSAALLDDDGNGIVITSINGRTEARTYAKGIEGGQSDHNLSPEEQEAIAEALGLKTKVRR